MLCDRRSLGTLKTHGLVALRVHHQTSWAEFLSLSFSCLATDLLDEWATRCFCSPSPSLTTYSVPISSSSLTASEQSLEGDCTFSPAAWWTNPCAIFSHAYRFLNSCIWKRHLGLSFPRVLVRLLALVDFRLNLCVSHSTSS